MNIQQRSFNPFLAVSLPAEVGTRLSTIFRSRTRSELLFRAGAARFVECLHRRGMLSLECDPSAAHLHAESTSKERTRGTRHDIFCSVSTEENSKLVRDEFVQGTTQTRDNLVDETKGKGNVIRAGERACRSQWFGGSSLKFRKRRTDCAWRRDTRRWKFKIWSEVEIDVCLSYALHLSCLVFLGISYDGDRSRQSQFLKRYFLDFDGKICFSEKWTKMWSKEKVERNIGQSRWLLCKVGGRKDADRLKNLSFFISFRCIASLKDLRFLSAALNSAIYRKRRASQNRNADRLLECVAKRAILSKTLDPRLD